MCISMKVYLVCMYIYVWLTACRYIITLARTVRWYKRRVRTGRRAGLAGRRYRPARPVRRPVRPERRPARPAARRTWKAPRYRPRAERRRWARRRRRTTRPRGIWRRPGRGRERLPQRTRFTICTRFLVFFFWFYEPTFLLYRTNYLVLWNGPFPQLLLTGFSVFESPDTSLIMYICDQKIDTPGILE